MISDERKTVKIPDHEWEETKATAAANKESMREVIRGLLAEYRARKGLGAGAAHIERRAVNKLDPDLVITTSRLTLQELRAQLAPGKWAIEERTVTSYRPPARGDRTPEAES